MELRADVALELRQRLLLAQPGPVRAVAGHRVEAVGHDQEVRGQGLVVRRDPVVAAAVEPLSVKLDGTRLGGRELEAPEQARR